MTPAFTASPNEQNSKNVGAYRIRPPHERTRQKIGISRNNESMLATIIPYSLTSGRMRYAPIVGGEKLTRNDATHHRIPQRTNSKNVGAYRIRPPQRRTCQAMGTFTEKRKYARRHHFPFAHIRAYAIRPNSWRRKTYTKRHQPSPHPPTNK